MFRPCRALLFLTTPLFLMTPRGAATQELMPVGTEFQVNDTTNQGQFDARVVYDSAGGFVVVWASGSSPGDDTGYSVQGQLFDSAGMVVGDQFQVNSDTSGTQDLPDIASGGPLDDFFIVWRSTEDGVDTDGRSINARRYASGGMPLEGEFTVNEFTTGEQSAPRVAIDSTGQAIVVWSSDGSPGDDTDRDSIQGQLLTMNGSFNGGQFQVNTYTTSNQSAPAISAAANGDFVVAWTSTGSPGSDTDDQSIQARLFTSNGLPTGDQFQVNTYTTFRQQQAAVAMQPGGDFVVAWSSSQSIDDDDNSIQARLFASDGLAIGDQFRVNAYTTSFQRDPSIAIAPGGGFLIAWDSGESVGDGDLTSVQAQLFDAAGLPVGGQIQVNTSTASFQFDTDVAWNGTDGFVVTWTSYDSMGNDSSEGSIQGQLYDVEPAIFVDGFESGETSAWSEVVN